jgi:hypothetical protein
MEVLTTLIAILVGIVAFDVVAMKLGVDSRESIGDDHAR